MATHPRPDLAQLEARVDALDEAGLRSLAATLREHLRPATPVTPATKRAFDLLKNADEGDPDLTDALEAQRDSLDAEYFELDAANDEEAPLVFRQARAISALTHAMKSVYADAVYEAALAVDDPRAMLGAMGLGDLADG